MSAARRSEEDPESLPPFASAALAYRAASAGPGGALGHARRRPLMATSDAEEGPPRILVVEPDARTRSLLEVGLYRAGFHVTTARTVVEAKHHLGLGRPLPAMVVCETDLLGEDGFNFCAQLRSDLRTALLPVVLLSQRPGAFHVEMASNAGADDYLPKPVFLNDVISLARLKAGQSAAQATYFADAAVLPIAELLRALLAGMRSGHLALEDGRSTLAFEQGRVVDARFEGHRGERALSRILTLCEGPYSVTLGPSLLAAAMDPIDLRALCELYLPEVSRWRAAAPRGLSLDAVLQINFPQLLATLPGLPDGLNALVRLFDGRRTVRDVIVESDLGEATSLLASTRLSALGVLEQADRARFEALPAPRMFEPILFEAPAPNPAPPAPADPVEAFSAGGPLDDLDSRLERALQDAAAAAAANATAAPAPRIAEVTYFAPEPSAAPELRARPKKRGGSSTGAVFAGLALVAAVGFAVATRDDLPRGTRGATSAALPDWMSPTPGTSPDGLMQLGLARYDNGDLNGARVAAEQALALDPRNEAALMLLATVALDRGQSEQATGYLRGYLRLEPRARTAAPRGESLDP